MNNWTRIPIDIPSENERKTILSILADNGLEVRVKREKIKNRIHRFIEYREQSTTTENNAI